MHARGFTLIEVLIALGILVLAALGTAQLLSAAAIAVRDARVHASAATAAAQRMEQLLAIEWGAPGLATSPPGALDNNVEGCVDFLDADGQLLGAGLVAPPGAAFVRRWSIDDVAGGRPNARVIRVLTRSLAADLAGARGARGEARLVTVRARIDP